MTHSVRRSARLFDSAAVAAILSLGWVHSAMACSPSAPMAQKWGCSSNHSSSNKGQPKASAECVVKDIRRATGRHFSAEDKIRIVPEGLCGEDSIAELCGKEG